MGPLRAPTMNPQTDLLYKACGSFCALNSIKKLKSSHSYNICTTTITMGIISCHAGLYCSSRSSQLDKRVDISLPSCLHSIFQSYERQPRGRKFSGQYIFDISISCDQYTWCLQQYGFNIKFWQMNKSNGNSLFYYGVLLDTYDKNLKRRHLTPITEIFTWQPMILGLA